MRVNFKTIRFLAATTAMSSVILPLIPVGMGLVAGSTTTALVEEPVMIPLGCHGVGCEVDTPDDDSSSDEDASN